MCPYIFVCISDYLARRFPEEKLLGKECEYLRLLNTYYHTAFLSSAEKCFLSHTLTSPE